MTDHDDARQRRGIWWRAGLAAVAVAVAVATALLPAVSGGSPAGASSVPRHAVAAGGYLYWSNTVHSAIKPGDGMIGRARLNGGDVNQKFITGASLPGMVLVYRGYVYWSDIVPLRDGAGVIGRARLNGTDINQDFLKTAQPNGPDAVVAGSGYLYWTNQNSYTIGRARLNGTDVNQSFIAKKDFLNLHGVAVGPAVSS
jgi:hypothetical protein